MAICIICSAEYTQRTKHQKTCGIDCRKKHKSLYVMAHRKGKTAPSFRIGELRSCAICSKQYAAKSHNHRTCSHECSVLQHNKCKRDVRAKRRQDSGQPMVVGCGYAWSGEEIALAELLFDLFPSELIEKYYNRYKPERAPIRTKKSLLHIAHTYGISRIPTLNYMSIKQIASILKVSRACIHDWIVRCNLQGFRQGVSWYIRAQSVLIFLERNPKIYQNALERSPEGLQYLSEIARSAKTLLEDLCRVRSRHDSISPDCSASIK